MTLHTDLPPTRLTSPTAGIGSRSRPTPSDTRRSTPVLAPAIGVTGAVALWWLLTEVVFAGRALVPEFSPRRTLTGLQELAGAGVVDHAASSVFRLLAGLGLATVAGVTVGAIVGSHPALERTLRPCLLFLRMVSPLCSGSSSIRRPATKVPLVLPKSRSQKSSPRRSMRACWRETRERLRTTSQSLCRPMVSPSCRRGTSQVPSGVSTGRSSIRGDRPLA